MRRKIQRQGSNMTMSLNLWCYTKSQRQNAGDSRLLDLIALTEPEK